MQSKRDLSRPASLSRRAFLGRSALAAAAAGMAPAVRAKPEIRNQHPDMRYRQIGDSDVYLSVISFGGLVAEESVYHYGIDRGVNFMHTSDSYHGGSSIETLGKVMKSKRDRVYLAVKDNFDNIDKVLKALNTDVIDFFMIARHAQSTVEADDLFETFEKYRDAGKVRWAGLTTHREVVGCVTSGIDRGGFSLIMPVLNQPSLNELGDQLKRARAKGIGVMGMKTMKGIKDEELETAFLKKLLANPAVTTVNKGIGTFEMFDRYAKAAREVLTAWEQQELDRYAVANRACNCMMCAECEKACPQQIEISTVLRCYDYYDQQLGDRDTAVQTYRELRRGPEICLSCGACEAVCPNGIAVRERLQRASARLSA